MPAPQSSRLFRAVTCGALLAALLLASGCGDDVEGSVSVVGSTTLLPYASSVAGDFAAQHQLASVSLRMDGTAAGMTMFCDGSASIVGASRPMNDKESIACRAAGVRYVQLMLAKDAIVVFTGPKNTAVTCVSPADLYALAGAEATGEATWRGATSVARALGSRTTLPDIPIRLVTPNAASGTRQLFIDRIIEPFAHRRKQQVDLRADHRDVDREMDMLAEADIAPGLLAIAGEATVRPWGNNVRTLAVRRADECVPPTPDNIATGRYPLSRPLYLYVNVGDAQGSAAARALTDALVAPEALETGGNGAAVPLTEQAIAATEAAWDAALAGAPTSGQ